MARTVNRKKMREEAEAAERTETTTPKKKAKKKAAKRKSRAKDPADIRIKAFWGVFNQSLKRVALYEFSQKKQAEKKAESLSKDGKSPHFVAKVKEPVEEA